MNSIDNKLPNISKSSFNKLLNKFVKKCFGSTSLYLPFFEEIHGMCKHCQIVISHIFLGNVYSLFE